MIEYVLPYIGTPFHWHGRSSAGLDCLGLIILPLRDAGLIPDDFDFTNYGNRPRNLLSELRTTGGQYLKEVSIEESRTSDLLVYKVGKTPAHLAWINGDHVIHAHQIAGVIQELKADIKLPVYTAFSVIQQENL